MPPETEDDPQREVEPSPRSPVTRHDIISDRTANFVIYTVTAMWVLNLLLDMFSEYLKVDYATSVELHGIFMTVVGGAFIARSKSREGDR